MYYIFFLIFILLFILTKNYDLSLFISLIGFLFITIYNYYSPLLILPFIIGLLIYTFNFWKKFHKYLSLINFVSLTYILLSIFEFWCHKYIMHCDKNNILTKIIQFIPFINNEYNEQCDSHIKHHLEVETDMSLNNVDDERSLFMEWRSFFIFYIIFLFCVIISKSISNFNISYKYLFVIGLIITFIYEYLWNKVHTHIHNYETDFSILRGPYDEKLLNLGFLKDILYDNHKNHHLQKGSKKGNYNVILLGADEWFGFNNKIIDNIEYCKSHGSEKICHV